MAEVIELSDSSDAASEREAAPASAATSPAASPAGPRAPAQSVGYSNAVEAALAMAAALETQDKNKPTQKNNLTKKKVKQRRRAKPAPPLLSIKTKKTPANHQRPPVPSLGWKSKEKQRPVSRARATSTSFGSSSVLSSDSDSSLSSRSVAHRRRCPRSSKSSAELKRRRRVEGASGRRRGDERRRERVRVQAPPAKSKPVEVVDLLSSSSSSLSDSSTSGLSRSSSLSSLTSSGDESSISKTRKKRLVLNDRVLSKRPAQSSVQPARNNAAAGRPQFPPQTDKKAKDVVAAAPHQGKRKRVLPHMRRQSAGSGQKRGRLPDHELSKKSINSKKPVMNGMVPRGPTSKPEVSAQNAALSISSSSSSSSSESSSASSPRPLPPRKSAVTVSAGMRKPSAPSLKPLPSRKSAATLPYGTTARVREGETDAFGRYRCRKSVPTGSASSTILNSASPLPVRPTSAQLPSPSPRKKRRVADNTYFDMDRVALDDLQAQERELAWIRSHRKQMQAQSRPPKSAGQKTKMEPEVISVEDHSDTNSMAFSEGSRLNDWHFGGAKVEVKPSAATEARATGVSRSTLLHPTSYRGIYLGKAPSNILQLHSAPFDSRCDHPLTFYDETETLEPQCAILESFGKPTQCISSVFPSEAAKPQSDVTRAVGALVAAHLPIIRSCHKQKVRAIMAEARQKISAYRSALNKHHQVLREQNGGVHVLPRKAVEKYAVKKLKATQHTCNLDAGNVTFQIGRGDGFVRERLVSTLIQINRVEVVQPLRKYTTSIGLRANYRVEDDPILRYTAITRPSSGDGGEDAMKKYALRVGNVADEEVMEYVLRLVVGRLGDSEQVFQALKSELDFSQAYTTYSELKKLHDSRLRATARLEQIDKLNRNGVQALDPDVATIVNLMEQSSLSTSSRAKVLSRRLQPPIGNLESSLLDSLLDGATAGMAALGLRATDNYADLVDVFCGSFCRMCYRYACHEHGGDHPLPARRVDPMYPRFRSAVSDAQNTGRGNEISSLDLLEDEVVCLGTDPNDVVESAKGVTVQSNAQWGRPNVATVQSSSGPNSDVEMSDSCERQQRKRKLLADPTEFTDDSHVSLVTTKMKLFLSKGTACSKMCWKNSDRTETSDQRAPLLAAELGVVRKLRRTMGDNSCLLAAVVGSASCKDLHELIKKEQASDERTMADGRSSRRTRNWKHGCRSGGSNHELLQRTRNQRLQDRGTENHEYKPCMHEGMCDSTGCSCMKRDHMCEKACACSRDCPNRFEGCNCPLSDCRTSKCPCFAALRECDPDVCLSCGASELAADLARGAIVNGAHAQAPSTCGNVNVIRSKHKRLGMSFSSIHGYGMYAREPITANEFVYEYAGAMLSQDEAERRGLIYDKMEMSYLFDLNEDAVLDALRSGNKSKFINHDGETPNCVAKVVSVCGVHHISIWALRDITVGEELVFDYGYKRSVGPDWSQRRTASKDTS